MKSEEDLPLNAWLVMIWGNEYASREYFRA